jgi:redox-sensitive bicupin YhaK (pirin superfamily)
MSSIVTRVTGRVHDLGGFQVRRILPDMACRQVGPFVFLDHIGPAQFAPGDGIDVRPHPHIGLATVTYLFDGALGHRDTLGSVQVIRPGDVNWMSAGSGIAHSERTPGAERAAGHRLHGLQFWVALPAAAEESAPGFQHHPAVTLPDWQHADGVRLRLIAGNAYGHQAPVRMYGELFYLDAILDAGAAFDLPSEHAERAVLVLSGAIELDGEPVTASEMAVLQPGAKVRLVSTGAARLVLFGGATLDGPRTLWWNFVSSRRERIEQAKEDWRAQRFGTIEGEAEFIPLPER